VILHINEECEEYLSEWKLREILDKYCAFMPVEIYLADEEKQPEEGKTAEPINDTHPLWQKPASECKPEEYTAFYTKVFGDYREPLFHMHLNADYPLNFKGILYFPRLRENFENLEGKIKLYYNQVFVADNIREVIPEYLLMLRGVLDCPELPLNVSRSYLQNSAYVTKVSAYIVKKVADKLNSMFTVERAEYEKLWDDLKTFVEYAAVSDRKFYDRVRPALLLSLVSGEKVTLDEYLEGAREKHENIVYYATDTELQAQYIAMYEAKGIKVARLEGVIDIRFAETVERYTEGGKLKFQRVDADLSALRDGEAEENETLAKLFAGVAGDAAKLTVKCERLADSEIPAVLTVSEQSRRMEDMMRMYMPDAPAAGAEATLLLNIASPIVARLADGSYGERAESVAKEVYLLAVLANRRFTAEEMKGFLRDSYGLLESL
jgi:molecular chaperone HtpG